MKTIVDVLSDKGSKYAVSGGPAQSRAEAEAMVASLRQQRRFNRADHHSWALILDQEGSRRILREDDGEAGAADIIARMLERADLTHHLVVVTRWYGGTNLGGARFRHITSCVRTYLADRG